MSARGATSRSSGAGGLFQPAMAEESQRASSVSAPPPTADISALLALQSVEDPLFRKKKAIRRGTSMLDTLEDIKTDLLVGRVGEGRLNKLMSLITQAREKSEPGLDALLDDIELRVRVELAKVGRFPGF